MISRTIGHGEPGLSESGLNDIGHEGLTAGHAPVGRPTDLHDVMSDLLRQIVDTERRNGAVLKQMHERIETLGRETRLARTQVPSAYAPGFERIEDGMALIASRIAEAAAGPTGFAPQGLGPQDPFSIDEILATVAPAQPQAAGSKHLSSQAPLSRGGVPQAGAAGQVFIPAMMQAGIEPQPLRSAAGHHRTPASSYASNVDPFDIVESMPGNPLEPWSPEGAAALAHLYASGEAAFADIEDLHASPQTILGGALGANRVEAPATANTNGQVADKANTIDRVWLEDRLVDITARLERSLSHDRTDTELARFSTRIEALELQIAAAMAAEPPAPHGQPGLDPVALKQIETQIEAIGAEFDKAWSEISRMRAIEEQLSALMTHVSEAKLGAMINRAVQLHMPAPEAADSMALETIAMAAAEAAVARMTQGGQGFAGLDAASNAAARVDDVHDLLTGYINARRDGDEQNSQAMDALQQAMLRVLDRLDALEGLPLSADTEIDYAAHGTVANGSTANGGAYRPALDAQPIRASVANVESTYRAPEATASLMPLAVDDTGGLDNGAQDAEIADNSISRQRAALQASAQRAASAQREKQKTEAAPKGFAAKIRAAMPWKSSSKPAAGSGKVMVSSIALAAVIGFGATLMLIRGQDDAVVAQMQSPASATQTGVLAGVQGGQVQAGNPAPTNRIPASQKSQDRAPVAGTRNANLPAANTGELPDHLRPETVTDLDGEGVGGAAAQTEANAATDGNGPQAQFVSGSYAPMNGMLLQASSDTDALNPVVGQGPNLPITGVGARSDLQTSTARANSVELPAATVGPLSLRLAAAHGDPSAEFEVGSRLAEGKGTDQDFKEAIRWYQRSAAQGFSAAQYRLATLYERGLGVKMDMARAKSWYQRAGEQGNVKAMHNLAVLAAGRGGANPDYTTAATWFTQAANHGLSDSQFNLAVLTESGLGVERDVVQAAMWFILAAQGGDKEAIRRRDQTKAKLSRNEWAAAEHLARSWQPMVPDKLANDARYAGELWKSRQAAAAQ